MKITALLTAKLSLLFAATTFGQLLPTWDGGDVTSNNWSAANNWNINAVPNNNGTETLLFAGGVRLSPNIDTPFSILSLQFDNAGAFSFRGNALTIGAGGIYQNDNDTQTFNNAIVLGANQTWTTNSGNLTFNGVVSGAFALTKMGAGKVTFTGISNISNVVQINAGQFDITDSGRLTNTSTYIAYGPGSHGTATVGGGVTAAGSWTNSEMYVGADGFGRLNITNGGTVTNLNGFIGNTSGSEGIVNVDGGTEAATWTNSQFLFVGAQGKGTLNILGGGTVISPSSYIGFHPGSQGTVTVGDATETATWTNSQFMIVGEQGIGTLNIMAGGTVTSPVSSIGSLPGSQGTVTVGGGTGTATWTNSQFITVGEQGTGTLNILGGGAVTNLYGIIGSTSGSHGTVNVGDATETATWTNSQFMIVGEQGIGTLNIMAGGTVTSPISSIGSLPGSQGTVAVGGGVGTATLTHSGSMRVGDLGIGTLNITRGGTVFSISGYIGYSSGSQGTVTVGDGTGTATWTNSGFLYVGGDETGSGGAATLNINNGGTVSVSTDTRLWNTGVINSHGGTANLGNLIMSGGTLNMFGGTVNLSNLTYSAGNLFFFNGTLNVNNTTTIDAGRILNRTI